MPRAIPARPLPEPQQTTVNPQPAAEAPRLVYQQNSSITSPTPQPTKPAIAIPVSEIKASPIQPASEMVQEMKEVAPRRVSLDRFRSAPVTPNEAVEQVPVVTKLSEVAEAPDAQPSTFQATTPAPQPIVSRRILLDMDLPGEESLSPLARLSKTHWQNFRRWGMRTITMAIILVIAGGGLIFTQGFLKAKNVFKGGTASAEALKANVDPNLLKGEGSGRVNILLLGRGGGTHDAPDLTDTMMVASVDPLNHTTALVSIPRDLWVNVPDAGVMKINAVWETGVYKYLGKVQTNTTNAKAIAAGYQEVDGVVNSVMGINIDYNVVVDFQAFQQAVDTVGGVNIDVPSDLVDPTMAWENGNNPVLAKAGIQSFGGKQALLYARSRETSSDFARSQRQRALLLALKQKVDTLGTLSNPLKISGLLNAFGNNVSTDLSLGDASRLYGILHKVSDNSITSIGLADGATKYVTTGNMNGQSIVLPKAGLFNYTDIQNFIHSQLKDPYIMKEHAKVEVLNGTTIPGLATTKADELKAYGYNVTFVGNTPNSGWTQTTLVDLTHNNKYTLHYLEEHFNQTAATKISDTTVPTNGADFVIIIGSDEATPTTAQAN